MAKKLLFCLLFCGISAFAFAFSPLSPQFCDAPAPTNFEVTSMASELVTLSWDPSIAGATHTLELMIEGNGAWVSLWVNPEVPGESIVLDNLEPGSYLARLATNCETGEAGEEFIDVPFRFKIIDLTILGRMPKNPQVVPDCQNIDYLNHEWVGFRVTEIATGLTNYFEFVWDIEGGAEIKRVFYDHPIVAVKENGQYPDNNNPIINTKPPFRIDHIGNYNYVQVGFVTCVPNLFPNPSIEICVEEENPPILWKEGYKFEAVTAEDILLEQPDNDPNISQDNSIHAFEQLDQVRITSPFLSNTTLFFTKEYLNQKDLSITVFGINGMVFNTFYTNIVPQTIELPLQDIPSGVFYVRLKTHQKYKVLKALKI